MPASAISAALPCAALSANDLSVEESVEVARLGRAVEATNKAPNAVRIIRVIGERFIGNSFPFMGLVSKTWSRMLGRIASYAEKGTSGDPTARDAESISYKNYEAGANERVRKRSQSR